jgi:holliday junction DNA helicase RuvA
MISFIKGKLVEKAPSHAVIDNNGVGFDLIIPTSTYKALDSVEKEVTLLTHLHVREDALTLFGFATAEEKELFKDLLSVTGIGPKLAIGIISAAPIAELYQAIASGNETALIRLPGLGKKTAQRLILDLKEKIRAKGKIAAAFVQPGTAVPDHIMNEAALALLSLGYNRTEADEVVRKAASAADADATVENLIQAALKI